MRKKELIILIAIVFGLGVISGVGGIFVLVKNKGLVKKVVRKLKERRIANIPKAKAPLVLCNFEQPRDLEKWNTSDAHLKLSTQNSTQGKSSAKFYLQKAKCPAIKLEKFFEKNRQATNWAKYEVVSFDIFNPYETKERLILQIKDIKGRRHKQNLTLAPLRNNHIEVGIAGLQSQLDITRVGQFTLFLWEPQSAKEFFIDNVRLLPSAQFEKRAKPISSKEFISEDIEEVYKTGDYFDFSKNRQKWKRQDPLSNQTYIEIPMNINSNMGVRLENFPVFGGVPFPRGELKSEKRLIVLDNNNQEIPIQTKVLCRWPDKSIKWLLLDMEGTVSPKEQKYFLRYSPDIKRKKIDTPLNVAENRAELSVVTGPLKFNIDKKSFRLFKQVWVDTNNDGRFSKSELISEGGDLVLVHNGREYRSSLDKDYKLEIEERGPLKVGLKASGWFTSKRGKRFCQFIIRIKAFRDKSYVKVDHTFVYTGYPENKYHYLYKGKRLPKNETIDAIYIETPLQLLQEAKCTFGTDSEIMQGDLENSLDFYQKSAQEFAVFEQKKEIIEGKRMVGWVDLSSDGQGIMVLVKDFWQQFPKGYRLDKEKRLLITDIWPKKAGELDFKTTQAAHGPGAIARGSAFGVAKTHSLAFYFHQGDFKTANAYNIAKGFSEDMLIHSKPEWIADSRTLGKLKGAGLDFRPAEEFLDRLFDWAQRQKEDFQWYGMIDFGDTLSWYRKEAYDESYDDWGWHPEGRWGWFNCEAVGTYTGSLLQYLRTGDYKYFRFGRDLARHIMDVDTCHYNTVANDKRLKRIFEEYSQVGSMHRHNGDHWGGRNEETTHTNLTGIMLYYYITGDGRARDVLDEIGSFFLKEPITYFRHPDIAPQRAIANVLWGDVLMYELTGDTRYKKQADKLANILYIGQLSNGSWLDTYNPVAERWEGKPAHHYMSNYTIPALIEYHKLTGNKAIADCIVRAAEYLSENEEYLPFLDALAYSYWITQDEEFVDEGSKRLEYTVRHQRGSGESIWDGMIYQKAYYMRPSEFLYSVPWILEVLREKKNEKRLSHKTVQ